MWTRFILMVMITLKNDTNTRGVLTLCSVPCCNVDHFHSHDNVYSVERNEDTLFDVLTICSVPGYNVYHNKAILRIFTLRNGWATSSVLTLCSDSNCNVDQIHPYLSKLLRRLFEKLHYEEQPLTGVNCGDLNLRVSEEEFREMVSSHIMLFSRMECGLYHSSKSCWQHCSYIRMSGEEIRKPVLSRYDIF